MTSLPRYKWPGVINGLSETNIWGINRFSDPNYLERRLDVEKYIRSEFIAKGGKPELTQPLYFFLGRHERFEEHERNQGYMISLKDISSELISFTYGDSLLAYNKNYRIQSGEKYQNTLCAKIYRLEDLNALFSHNDFPKNAPLNIEVQLWATPSNKIVKKLER